MIYSAIRSVLFQLDAEHAHEFTSAQIEHLQQVPLVLRTIDRIWPIAAAAAMS